MAQRILIVDDDEPLTIALRRELVLEGFDVVTSFSAEEAIVLTYINRIIPFDLFILDIMMKLPDDPDNMTDGGLVTGLHLARELRKVYLSVPIIFWSSFSFNAVVSATENMQLQLGNIEIIQKGGPKGVRKLKKTVHKYLSSGNGSKTHKRVPSFLRRLWKSLLLQPNISGVGIDFKTFFEDTLDLKSK